MAYDEPYRGWLMASEVMELTPRECLHSCRTVRPAEGVNSRSRIEYRAVTCTLTRSILTVSHMSGVLSTAKSDLGVPVVNRWEQGDSPAAHVYTIESGRLYSLSRLCAAHNVRQPQPSFLAIGAYGAENVGEGIRLWTISGMQLFDNLDI